MKGRVVVAHVRLRKRWAFWRKPHMQLCVVGYTTWWFPMYGPEVCGTPVIYHKTVFIGGGRRF